MIGKVVGALVGRELDRRDGSGGLKGAALGAVVAGGLRRLGPLGVLLGGGYVAKKALDRRRAGRRVPPVGWRGLSGLRLSERDSPGPLT